MCTTGSPAEGWSQTPARSDPRVEVVVTLKAPPLAQAFAQTRTIAYATFARPQRLVVTTPASRDYLDRLARTQRVVAQRIRAAIPAAVTRWHYGVVLDGFSVVVPQSRLARLQRIPGVESVWPSATYHLLLDRTPQLIGAPTVWGPTLATAGEGMKIGVIDDGIDHTHPFFNPSGYAYPPGFPKGQTAYTTPKVIVARAFAPPGSTYAPARLPFDVGQSEHGTHVSGIAAGNNGTLTRSGFSLSGIAPRAYLGNYKAMGVPSEFGLNGNSPELAAAVEAAVRDGMDVINLSLGETDIEPTRDVLARALNAAADAGVVSTVAAGNSGNLGLGSIDSPGSAVKAIAAAASTGGHDSIDTDAPTDFSSLGPAPYSLAFKPEVTAPGDGVASSIPGGSYAVLSGTSMAAPHVAGAVAVLKQRHPTWTAAQLKSALITTGVPVRGADGEVSPLREGGGRIDLPRADNPLFFAAPSSLTFGLRKIGVTVTRTVELTGGTGTWTTRVTGVPAGLVTTPAQITIPGALQVRLATRGLPERDYSGFVNLTRGSDSRRIPFWVRVERPRLPLDPHITLTRPGTYSGDTRRGAARVTSYRYPDIPVGHGSFPVRLPGREFVYRVHVRKRYANLGVAVTSRARRVSVEPRIVRSNDENRLAGEVALPYDTNPYRATNGGHRLVVGVLFPAPGTYDVVFDTPRGGRPGRFAFRLWQGDTTPPSIQVLGVRGSTLRVAVTDRGSGVDPTALAARVDGEERDVAYTNGVARVSVSGLGRGRHTLIFTAADYQEVKNNENVAGVLPNTRRVQRAFSVP
ncbi:MAG TPA: S8 family serine peptidase [Gaiellaceae bacterium]|nr:S8 family serine peptidase [Gaiellaceae bacterium]HWJ45484.1 S8 family serine peptidase [Gaiellaceae bacterium]